MTKSSIKVKRSPLDDLNDLQEQIRVIHKRWRSILQFVDKRNEMLLISRDDVVAICEFLSTFAYD